MLHKLQSSFLKAVYDMNSETDVLPFIQQTEDKTSAQQLAIYRSSIFGGLKKALAETYPVTKELVGEEFFNMMSGQYIKEYPCKVQDLNDYGKELPAFIKNLKQARSVPYLADVAWLEWAYNIALNSEVQFNNIHEISQLTAEQQSHLKILLPNGSALIHSIYPVDKIWNMHSDDGDSEIELNEKDRFVIVWKDLSKVKIDILSCEQYFFLQQINKQKTFVDVCQSILNTHSECDINKLFSKSIQNGWVQSYSM